MDCALRGFLGQLPELRALREPQLQLPPVLPAQRYWFSLLQDKKLTFVLLFFYSLPAEGESNFLKQLLTQISMHLNDPKYF